MRAFQEKASLDHEKQELKQETSHVLMRNAEDIHETWGNDEEEKEALLSYITRISDRAFWEEEIIKEKRPMLLFFGGRIPKNGIKQMGKLFHKKEQESSAFISESAESCTQNPLAQDASQLAEMLRRENWHGERYVDLTAQNTGDQCEALVRHLQQVSPHIRVIVIAASIDHVGRLTASCIDALETAGLLSQMRVIPLALGSWNEIVKETYSYEMLAFGKESQKHDNEVLAKFSGQYTFRWQRSLHAKQQGLYKGRSSVPPSQALNAIMKQL